MREARRTGYLAALRIKLSKLILASIVGSFALPLSALPFAALLSSAHAATYTISCSGGGSFSVSGPNIPSNSGANCVGIATIPLGITTVDANAFEQTSPSATNLGKVTGVVWPASGLTTISSSAFQFTNLTSISVPSSVTSIAAQAFADNPNLASASLAGGTAASPLLTGYYIFNNTPNLTSLSLGSGVMDFGWLEFAGSSITSITGGSGLRAIGDQTLSGTNLQSFSVPSTVTTIGIESFRNTKLTTIQLPCALNSIGTSAYLGITTLSTVQMCADTGTANSNFSMGGAAFGSNANLKIFSFGTSLATTVNVKTWNDGTDRVWNGDTSLQWIQYCGSGSAFSTMTAHLVAPYVPAGVVVSCLPPKSVLGSLKVTSNGNNYSAGGVTNNFLSLTLPSGKEISDNSSYTVEAWVKVESASNTGSTLGYGSIALSNSEYGRVDGWNQRNATPPPGSNSYYMTNAGNTVAYCDTTDPASLCPNVVIPRGQWVHVALQKSIVSGQTRLTTFINGQVAGTRTGLSNNAASLKYLMIGGFGDNNSGKVSYAQIRVTSGAIYPTDGVTTFTPQTSFTNSVSSGTVVALFQPLFNSTVESLVDNSGTGTLIKSYVGSGNVTTSTDIPLDPPAANSLTVVQGPLAGGTSSTLVGTGLTGATSITVGGNAATSVLAISDTSVSFTTPSSLTAGAKDIVVTAPNGTATLSGGFNYLPLPTASSLTVGLGPLAGGVSSVLIGTGLTGATSLSVGGVAATGINLISDTSLAFTVPASATLGSKNVIISTPGGSSTLTNGFTYVSAPTITSLSVLSSSLSGGILDTITGTNLTGTTSVTVNSVNATFTVLSSTTLTFTVPTSSSSGAKDLVVVAPGGTVTRSAGFTYNSAALTPSIAAETASASGFQLLISNYDSNYTWAFANSVGGSSSINASGLVTVTGIAPGTYSTESITVSRTGYDTGILTSPSYKSLNGTALSPTFGTETATADGFQILISNYSSNYTWAGTDSLGGSTAVSIAANGVATVTGVGPGTASTVSITAIRSGYDTGTATTSSYKSINGSALTPNFTTETGTADGFQIRISNYDSNFTWSGTNSLGGTVTINSGTGVATVTGLAPGAYSTLTVSATRAGYDTGTATSISYKSLNGSALTPNFTTETATADGFQILISNYSSNYTWSGISSAGGSVAFNSSTGVATVSGIAPGAFSTITVTTTRAGYDTGTATSNSFKSTNGTALTPTFTTEVGSADGFTLLISNYSNSYTWSGTNSAGGTVSFNSSTGIATVTGVAPGTYSTVTILTTRLGYDTGTATSSSYKSNNGAQLTPTFGASTATVDGFTVPITNYDTNFAWVATNSLGDTTTISALGIVRVAGMAAGTSSTVTLRTTRAGYDTGTATSAAIFSASASDQPTNVSATIAARSAVVSWTAPADTGGTGITDYTVKYSSDNGANWNTVSHTPSASTQITVTGLTDGTVYIYEVAAVNIAGQGPFALSAPVTTSYYVACTAGSFWVAGQTIPSAAGQGCTGTATIPVGIAGVSINAFAPGSGATSTNRALTAINIPASGFTNIDQGGFMNLGLTSLTIPASVTLVGQYGFQNNPLTSVTIVGAGSGSSTYLGQSVFGNQAPEYGLATKIALTLGSGKIEIGDNFGSGTAFSTVDFGSGLSSIGVNAFKQNGIARGWIPLFPSTITSIGQNAFTYNPNMTTIRFGSDTTSSITAVDNAAFDPSYVKSVQYCGPSGTVLSNYLKNRLPSAVVWCNYVAPNAPTITSTSPTNQQVTVNWSKGSSLNEAPTDTFTVQYSTGGGAWTTVAYDTTTPLSSRITGLTNGTTYSFRVAANNIAGTSSYSNTVQATPLGLAIVPTFDTSVAISGGFTFNITNYDSRTSWAETITAGTGTITAGTPSGNRLPITVSGMNPGATTSIQVTTTRATYDTGIANTSGTSLSAALTPVIATPVVNTDGYSASITNYDSNYTWRVTTSSGSASITNGLITVTGANFATSVTETVTAARATYDTGSATVSATTLAALTITYYGNGNNGGLAPSDTTTYHTNGTGVILGNTGNLSKPGYQFTGWNLNSGNTGTTYIAGNSYTLANAGVAFYAQWTALPYHVIYHATEAGSGAVPTDPNTYSITNTANIRGNAGNLQRTGYVFAGWAANANRTGRIYISGDTYTVGTNDVDFWAAWTPNTYSITYDANGATGSPSKSSDSYTVDAAVARLATVGSMSKTGYNFGGWGTQAVGGVIADSFTVASNITLYAQWNIASYTLTYDLAGGTGTIPAATSTNYLSTITLPSAADFTKVDTSTPPITYAFVAWSGPSGTYNPGQTYYMPAGALTFTALWTRIYNVTYSFSGGSVVSSIPDEQKISGDTITVSIITPRRDGYDFAGWVDQSGQSAAAGSIYTVGDGHYLLYATWTAISYSVTYDAAGGSDAPAESGKTIGQSFAVGAAPTKTGYDFKGWSDNSHTYAPGAPYVVATSNIVFTAQWQAHTYVVSYDLNGGSGSAGGNHAYVYGTPDYTLPTTGFSLTDYTFANWATALGGPSVGTTFEASSDITLYANWNIAIYRLSFDAQGGSSDSATAKVTIGQSLTLPRATRPNYTLQGWSNQPTGGSLTAGGASYTPPSDQTLYAQWALQVFTVTFNANGGTSDSATASFTYGSTAPLALPSATRSDYIFAGWYSAASGGYFIGGTGSNYTPSNTVTLYAHWTQASLDGLGDAVKIAEVTVIAGNSSSFTAGSQGSSATVSYTADSLPNGTVISAYVQASTARAASLIDPNSNYILSMVVAWVAPDGTVPNTAPGKPIVMTISNVGITQGSRVYGLLGSTPRYLGTATQDGSVQVSLTQDPTVTVAITRPDSATALTAVDLDDVSALVSWTAPVITGGSPITNYIATSNDGKSCSTTSNSCVVTGLTASTNYTFTVVAQNAIGSSDQSVPSPSITTDVATTPTPPAPPPSGPAPSIVVAAIIVVDTKTVAAVAPIASDTATSTSPINPVEQDSQTSTPEVQALVDAANAAHKYLPAVSLYSVTKKFTLTPYELKYLRKYISTLKPNAIVTCIGYTYTALLPPAKATALAKKQAASVCAVIKSYRKTLRTVIAIRSAKSAPLAAVGAKWVSVSYRVDGYDPATIAKVHPKQGKK